MDCFVNATQLTFSNHCYTVIQDKITSHLNTSDILPWLFSRLRIFLYLSNPYEESFEFEHQVADYHTETLPLLVSFVFLEWLVLWFKGKPLPFLGDSLASSSMIVMMECTRILTRGIEHYAYGYIYRNYRLIDLAWDSVITWYCAAIFVDFCYYWGHRASHEINVLWAHHQAHHSSETYSIVNTFRLPFTQDWLYSFAYLPMAFVIPPTHYLVHLQLNLLYQLWLHTEIVGKLGPIEWIFNTPTHHQVHHGSNKVYLDKNYGAWLIIWDRMFGTFQEKKENEEIVYGLVDQPQSFNPLYLQLFYHKKVYEKWCSQDGFKNKVFSLIKGPGWRPGSPWTGYIDDVPDVRGREKYSYPSLSLWKIVYLFIHFFLLLLSYENVSFFRERMSSSAILFHLVYVMSSLTSLSMFFDQHRMAPLCEFVRCSFICFYTHGAEKLAVLSHFLSWSELNKSFGESFEYEVICVLRYFFGLSALIWGAYFTHDSIANSLLSKRKFKIL